MVAAAFAPRSVPVKGRKPPSPNKPRFIGLFRAKSAASAYQADPTPVAEPKNKRSWRTRAIRTLLFRGSSSVSRVAPDEETKEDAHDAMIRQLGS